MTVRPTWTLSSHSQSEDCCVDASSVVPVLPRSLCTRRGGKLRLVFDCRVANAYFSKGPAMEMGAPEAFTSISVPPGSRLYSASADIEACFYQCGIDPELSQFFCLPSLTGQEALSVGLCEVEGVPVAADDAVVYPALSVVPMGWSFREFTCILFRTPGCPRVGSHLALGRSRP